jgi:hypothetical protein
MRDDDCGGRWPAPALVGWPLLPASGRGIVEAWSPRRGTAGQACAARVVIHQFDPAMAPDTDFIPGTPALLAPGNHGRMLDRRRTPVRVGAIRVETGTWICEVLAFEDRGARWSLPFEAVTRFQFARASARLDTATLRRVRGAIRRFDRDASRPPDENVRATTERRISEVRSEVASWLEAGSRFIAEHGTLDLGSRDGSPLLAADLEALMRSRGLWDLECGFADSFVSNPGAGEIVKVHTMALADLGLAGYHGTIVRDPASLEGTWRMERRREHIVTRIAFVREALTRIGVGPLVLYRAISAEGPLVARRPGTLVSATFSLDVAMSLLGPAADGVNARLDRQVVPLERVFMTYLETAALNRQFREAEAVLLEDPDNPRF